MRINFSFKGILEAIIYVIVGIYTWVESIGLNAYVFTVLLVFMLLDMILGIWKSSVVKTLENPTSRKAKRGVLVKLLMFTIPAISGLIWGAFDKDGALKIVNLQLSALMVAEGYSNIANAYIIYTGDKIEEFDAVTYVFKKVSEKIKNLLKKLLDDE